MTDLLLTFTLWHQKDAWHSTAYISLTDTKSMLLAFSSLCTTDHLFLESTYSSGIHQGIHASSKTHEYAVTCMHKLPCVFVCVFIILRSFFTIFQRLCSFLIPTSVIKQDQTHTHSMNTCMFMMFLYSHKWFTCWCKQLVVRSQAWACGLSRDGHWRLIQGPVQRMCLLSDIIHTYASEH